MLNELKPITPEDLAKSTKTKVEVALDELVKQATEEKDKQIAELKSQIEKMKCCGNCIHCYEGAYHNGYRCKDHTRESFCDNWEWMTDEVRKEMLEDDI